MARAFDMDTFLYGEGMVEVGDDGSIGYLAPARAHVDVSSQPRWWESLARIDGSAKP